MRDRVLTAVVLAPLVLLTLFATSPWPLLILGLLTWLICIIESRALLTCTSQIRLLTFVGFPMMAFGALNSANLALSSLLIASLFLIGIGCAYLSSSGKVASVAVADLASLWYAAPLAACIALHGGNPSPAAWSMRSPLLLVLLPVWAGDIAGIFAGKAFGKRLLAPVLSPKKTVEGAIGNLIAAVLTAAVVGNLLGYSAATSIACGALAGVAGQLGDLFESYLKRRADVKDSGTILPGHGGVLDRIDSLLFVAPAVSLVVAFIR